MRPEQLARKIAVCGQASVVNDTVSNFTSAKTDWFPGQAKVLVDPHEAFLAKILLIQKAKTSIDISTYIFTVDDATNALMSELEKAMLRGVNVRMSVDEEGSLTNLVSDRYSHLRSLLL